MFDNGRTELNIPHISVPSLEEFERNFLRPSKPVIIKGATESWKPFWTPEYLRDLLKDKRFPVRVSKSKSYVEKINGDAQFVSKVELSFVELYQQICASGSTGLNYYLQQQLLGLPELVEQIQIPLGLDRNKITIANLWFGSARNVTPLHFDPLNNFFVQVYGCKEVTLVDPHQSSCVYPMPVSSEINTMSRVDIDDPDYEQFPDFKRTKAIRFTVEPGDVLFIPPFWWHHVRSLEVSISVNFWWRPLLVQSLVPMALRDLPEMYPRDRLQSLRYHVDTTDFASLLEIADYVHTKGFKQPAILVAGAALEDHVRAVSRDNGIEDRTGQMLRPIENLTEELERAGVYSTSDALNIQRLSAVVSAALDSGGHQVPDCEIRQFIQEITTLTQRNS